MRLAVLMTDAFSEFKAGLRPLPQMTMTDLIIG